MREHPRSSCLKIDGEGRPTVIRTVVRLMEGGY
jgi:hypothetical protein